MNVELSVFPKTPVEVVIAFLHTMGYSYPVEIPELKLAGCSKNSTSI